MRDYDELWPRGPRFRAGGFRLCTDSVLLAAFVNTDRVRRCIDLGCGSGILSVLLAEKNADMQIDGVEIQAEAAVLCQENLTENGLDGRCSVTLGDLRQSKSLFPAGGYDLVVSNPPYFPTGSGYEAPDPSRAETRDERNCTLSDLCAAAAWLCRWGGRFALVHRPERLSEVFCAMTAVGMEPKRLRLVQVRAAAAPSLALIEGRRGGRPGLAIEAPLVLCREDGGETDEIKTIYHREETL
jgi:tRNA1Val (adenine37-N6)-methyltransferase